jgi:hypothetical protein
MKPSHSRHRSLAVSQLRGDKGWAHMRQHGAPMCSTGAAAAHRQQQQMYFAPMSSSTHCKQAQEAF